MEEALSGIEVSEIRKIEYRLQEIDEARNDYIFLISTGSIDEESLDEQFQKLYDEEQSLNERLEQIKAENSIGPDDSDRIDRTLKEIDKNSCELLEYNDILTRKLIECVRVVSKTEIQIIFKGGYEVTAEVEK